MKAIFRLENPAAQKPLGSDPEAETPDATDSVQS